LAIGSSITPTTNGQAIVYTLLFVFQKEHTAERESINFAEVAKMITIYYDLLEISEI
jgi:hypothetical protein